MTLAILEAKNLNFTYGEGTPFRKIALHQVSFAVEKGDLIGVIGHTGSGKSTLVQHLNGLIRCTGGQVLLDGEDIWAKPREIRRVRFRIGMVFQYPEYQLFEETVRQDIAFGPKNMGLSPEEVAERVARAAESVQLRQELLDASPFELSGGQKRRAAIAGVLAMQPEVLILDEPTAGLDPRGRERILRLIESYRRKNDVTVLLVSHNMEDVARIADKVLVMNDGAVAMYAPTAEVFGRAEELRRMGLSVPAVTRVFLALKAQGLADGAAPYTMEQAVAALSPLVCAKGGAADAE